MIDRGFYQETEESSDRQRNLVIKGGSKNRQKNLAIET